MAKFLCITLNPAIDVTLELPELKLGNVNRIQTAQTRPAGKGLNVAQVLNGLGHDIVVTGFLGQDNRAMFDDDFIKQGFDNQFVYVVGQTRQNIKIAETHAEHQGRMTDINGKGFSVDDTAKHALFDNIATLAKAVDVIVLSGSLPQQFSLQDFDKLIKTIQHANPRLAIDSSGEALKIAVNNHPFLLKPNNDELLESFGQPANSLAEQQALIKQIDSQTPHWVISLGEQGVNWLNGKQNLNAKPPAISVKSTVGAGDTLLAGILHGLATDLPYEQTLATATALASHTVSQVGCELPDSERLQQLQAQVVIEKL